MASPSENLILDLGALVKEAALKAVASSRASGADQFDAGRAMAWYQVASLLQQQAAALGLSLAQVGLGGFDAERDVLAKLVPKWCVLATRCNRRVKIGCQVHTEVCAPLSSIVR